MNSKAASLCARSFAAQAAQKAAPAAFEGFKTTTLPNGIVVATVPSEVPVSRVALALRVGSRDETYDNRGISHMMRTLVGTATENFSAFGITRRLNQSGSSLNCIGGRESTVYVLDCLQPNITELLPLLAEVSLRPAFKPWEVDDCLSRLKLEIARATPEAKTLDLLHQVAFRAGLGNSVICPPEMVGRISEKNLRDFVADNYVSGRAAVIGIGVNHTLLVDFANSFNLPTGSTDGSASKFCSGERRVDTKGGLAYVAIAGRGASLADPKSALVYGVLQHILGSGPSTKRGIGCGILTRTIAETNELASVFALNASYSDAGLFGLFVVAKSDAMDKVLGTSMKTLKSCKINQAELTRGKALMKADLLEIEDSNARLIEELAQQAVIRGNNFLSSQDFIQMLDSVTTDDVNKALSQVVNGKMSMGAYGNLKTTPFLDEL
ncbi:cytochrome b-c1 complex subunit 2, mitochondrial-like [Artemia franciscana]|uniref:cytochrome b-c1 complex subunit 2, mitochondrial-like n=1 Tax=Artemia franciscana TaxID=6661 RepID=UPI0032DA03C9